MTLSVSSLINKYKQFARNFWLGYKTLEKLHPNFDDIKMNLLKSKRIDPKYYADLPTYQMEKDLLDLEWKKKSEEARAIGTSTHEYIHNLFVTDLKGCKLEFGIPTDTYSLSSDLQCNSGFFVEQKLEVKLDDDYSLVGIPDYFIIKDGVVSIKDWKTSETPIKFKSMYELSTHQNKKLKFPLNFLDDVEGVHYQIQLSLYMWMILKLRPDLKPGQLEIVWIKDNKVKKSFPVEYLGDKIDKFINWHLKSLHLEQKMSECREIKYDKFSEE